MSLVTQGTLRDSLDLIKRTVAKGATDLELELFIRQCERTGLDPFARQIYAIKRYDAVVGAEVMQTQVSIDGLRSLASETSELAGQDGPYWCGADGLWTDVWLEESNPRAARVVVYRGDRRARFTGVALFSSYCQRKRDGTPTRMWAQMGPEMLAKCAEALALRKAFPQGLSGLYTPDEMGQAENHRPDQGRSNERPPELRRSPATPSDEGSLELPPPNAPESHTGPSQSIPAGDGGPLDRMRETVSAALGRLDVGQRAEVVALGDRDGLSLPEEKSFTPVDANAWLELIARVRSQGDH